MQLIKRIAFALAAFAIICIFSANSHIGICFISYSQIPVSRYDSIAVIENSDTLKNAWAGGINSALFSEIDLNLDGKKDLFIFEKDGYTIRTFLNDGNEYYHAPQYQNKFPKMTVYALLADYNCDNKNDIFTFAPGLGGMAVHKNISDLLDGLKFELITPILKADYNHPPPNLPVNLYVAATDIPALSDIDGDGDLDILSFESGGTFVNYFKNLSLETYGNCDSLKFQLADACWGKFAEDPFDNSVNFPYNCKAAVGNPNTEGAKHSGSTLLAINTDGDGDKDLILGDISFKNMVHLTNGGDAFSAAVISQNTSFPSNTTPVNILFPSGFFLDVNNDSIKDLIVTPNTPNATENFTSVWFYNNSGTNDFPVFNFQKNNFLQETMIDLGSGCNPAFFDYNADGLMDLVVGNYGYYNSAAGLYDGKLALFENTGDPNNPKFSLITRDYMNISSEKINGLYPSFGDIDSDGDLDMFIGEYTGRILFYENSAGAGNTANFILKDAKYKNIDVGSFAAPQIIDVNRDGLLDLLVGEQDGTINFFQNTGTATLADFNSAPTIAPFGGIDVMVPCCTGYSSPFLFENSPGNYALLVGSEQGTIYYYTNIDGNLNGNFSLADSISTEELRTNISMADINGDGKFELAVGGYPGGMHILKTDFFTGEKEIFSEKNEFDFEIFPNPNDGNFMVRIANHYGFTKNELSIYNIIGEKIYAEKIRPVPYSSGNPPAFWRGEIRNFPRGIYFVKVSSGEKFAVKKMVKF